LTYQCDVVLHGGHTLRPVEVGPPGFDVHQFAAEGPEDDGPVVDEVVGVGAGDGDGPARAVGGDQLLADGDQLLIGLGGFHAGGREHVLVVVEGPGLSEPRDAVEVPLVGGGSQVGGHEGVRATELVDVQLGQPAGGRQLGV